MGPGIVLACNAGIQLGVQRDGGDICSHIGHIECPVLQSRVSLDWLRRQADTLTQPGMVQVQGPDCTAGVHRSVRVEGALQRPRATSQTALLAGVQGSLCVQFAWGSMQFWVLSWLANACSWSALCAGIDLVDHGKNLEL